MRAVKEDRSSPPTTPTCQQLIRLLAWRCSSGALTDAVPVALFMVVLKRERELHPSSDHHLCAVMLQMSI